VRFAEPIPVSELRERFRFSPPQSYQYVRGPLTGLWNDGAFKFLIDTNIVIGLEDDRPVEVELTDLTRQCSANGVRLFVDAAVDDDIYRDADLARRAVTLSKLEKFERLKGIVYPDDPDLARRYGPINRSTTAAIAV
jgi:hypothetical protein